MVKSTISDIPKDERTPAHEAESAIAGEVWKKTTAMKTVSSQPRTPIRVPDWWRNTRPMKMTRMGRIARIHEMRRSTMPLTPEIPEKKNQADSKITVSF
jgi:hypothetical protein